MTCIFLKFISFDFCFWCLKAHSTIMRWLSNSYLKCERSFVFFDRKHLLTLPSYSEKFLWKKLEVKYKCTIAIHISNVLKRRTTEFKWTSPSGNVERSRHAINKIVQKPLIRYIRWLIWFEFMPDDVVFASLVHRWSKYRRKLSKINTEYVQKFYPVAKMPEQGHWAKRREIWKTQELKN